MSTKKILLVDDDKIFITLIQGLLKQQGYKVYTATNGTKALHILETCQFDLIIMDVLMPALTGYEVLQKLKSKGLQNIPLVVTSANKNMQEYFDNWAIDGFIRKPFQPQAFLTMMKDIFNAKDSKAQTETQSYKRKEQLKANAKGFASLTGKKVVLVANKDSSVTWDLKECLEYAKAEVSIASYEEDIYSLSAKLKPDFIFFQFYDGLKLAQTSLPVLWEVCRSSFDLKNIPHLIYYRINVEFVPFNSSYPLISYLDSEGLLKTIEQRLKFIL